MALNDHKTTKPLKTTKTKTKTKKPKKTKFFFSFLLCDQSKNWLFLLSGKNLYLVPSCYLTYSNCECKNNWHHLK
jgi:hypothetical protein